MRLYAEVARRSFRRWSTYRAATIAGIFTNSIFGFIRASVLVAVANARPGAGGFTAKEFVTYSVLTQALLAYVGVFGGSEEIGERIQTGDVVCDLYRPASFQAWWLAADIGRGAFQIIGRGVPIMIVGALVYGIQMPPNLAAYALATVSIAVGLIIGFGIRFIVQISGFWLLDTRGVNQLAITLMMFASGMLVPLSLFPTDLERVMRLLPFAGLVQVPADVFLGAVQGYDAVAAVLGQCAWALVLLALGQLVMQRATQRVVIQGG